MRQRRLSPSNQEAAGAITFEDATNAAGLSSTVSGGDPHGVGLAFVDVNQDGWEDLFIINGDGFTSKHYRNNGNGTFSDVTVSSGVADILNGKDGYSIAAGDIDSDGDIDVYYRDLPSGYSLSQPRKWQV